MDKIVVNSHCIVIHSMQFDQYTAVILIHNCSYCKHPCVYKSIPLIMRDSLSG